MQAFFVCGLSSAGLALALHAQFYVSSWLALV